MQTQLVEVPVSSDMIGRLVEVSNDGTVWEHRTLARIIVLDDDVRLYVCWLDDPESNDKLSSARVHTYERARLIDPSTDPVSALQLYVSAKREISEIEASLKDKKAYLANVEKNICESWPEGMTKQEVRVEGRRASLTIGNEIYCNILKENREGLKTILKENGMEFLVTEDVDTAKLKSWIKETAERNYDGSFNLGFLPKEIADRVSTFQAKKLAMRNLGVRESA